MFLDIGKVDTIRLSGNLRLRYLDSGVDSMIYLYCDIY